MTHRDCDTLPTIVVVNNRELGGLGVCFFFFNDAETTEIYTE